MRFCQTVQIIRALGLLAALASPALAQAPRSDLAADDSARAAERLLQRGDISGALAIYDSIPPEQLSATDRYNLGVALYRDGRLEESAQAFERTAAAANSQLAAKARFNLGNTHYARALAAIDNTSTDSNIEAIPSLQAAVDSFRSALRLDPQDQDARFNLELATKLIRKLQQQQQQQQQQPEQEQDSEQQDSEQQDSQQQDSQQQDSQQQDSQQQDSQQQDSQQQDSQQQDSEQQDSEQQDSEQQDSQQQDSQQPPAEQDSTSDSSQSPQPSSPQQEPNEAEPSSDQPSSSGEPSEEESTDSSGQPEEAASDPAETPASKQPSDPSQDSTGTPEPPATDSDSPSEPPQGELTAPNASDPSGSEASQQVTAGRLSMSQEEARKLLQSIRDREMARRRRLRSQSRPQRIPVERDW